MKYLKMLSITAAFTMLFAVNAFAMSDTSWYSGEEDTFIISDGEQLAGLAELVNSGTDNFSGKEIQLDADIDLKDIENWTPIGNTAENYFAGSVDGNNHTISNLKITEAKGYFNGLFGVIYEGKIKNLKLKDTSIAINRLSFTRSENDVNTLMAGGFAGMLYGSSAVLCENLSGEVKLDASVDTLNDCVGGIAGSIIEPDSGNYSVAEVRFCGNGASISSEEALCGGIGANGMIGNGEIGYSYNKGSISSKSGMAAGIIASVTEGGSVSVCYNSGKVTSENIHSGLIANVGEGTWVSACNDFEVNDSRVFNGGFCYDICYNSDGNMAVQAIGDKAEMENVKAVDFNAMSTEEIRDYVNNISTSYNTAVGRRYPVLWWESTYGVESIYGDIDGDGELTCLDAALMLKALGGIGEFSLEQSELADFDRNGAFNLFDVVKLQGDVKYIAEVYF